MFTVVVIFLLGAIGTAIAAAMGKCPVYVPVLLLCVIEALQVLPLR